MEMDCRGDHQSPWVTMLLLGHGAHTTGSTTKSKDVGKGREEHKASCHEQAGRSPKEQRLLRYSRFREEKASSSATHRHPAYSTWTVKRGRQRNVRTHHQHPPETPPHGCLPFRGLADPQLSLTAQGTTGKDGPCLQERDKRTGHAQAAFPSARAGSPSSHQQSHKGLSTHVIH